MAHFMAKCKLIAMQKERMPSMKHNGEWKQTKTELLSVVKQVRVDKRSKAKLLVSILLQLTKKHLAISRQRLFYIWKLKVVSSKPPKKLISFRRRW
jgi:hypothetical protein